MIYYKKRSLFSQIKNRILGGFIAFAGFILICYIAYLFILPLIINETNVENALNSYLSKNSKLTLDVENIKISPNLKFQAHLSADKIKLNYNSKSNFITINQIKSDINLLNLFFGYIDLQNIKIKDLIFNTNFDKKQSYSCFDYLPLDILDFEKHNSRFKIRNIKLLINDLNLNIYDENIKKQFKIKANNIKFEKKYNAINKLNTSTITTQGKICAKNKIINDFNLNVNYKYKDNQLEKFKTVIEKLNYNPFYYGDKYDFYAKTAVNLKINKEDKNPLTGQIALDDLSFRVNDIKIPKNNLLLSVKNNKIYSDFNFKLIKNQFIKVKSVVDISKNKYIELYLNSNEINLFDFHQIISNLAKIFNLNIDFSTLELNGILNLDLYLKSNFSSVNSKGILKLENGSIKHKKLNLSLEDINSYINFKNNNIDIVKTSAYFEQSKFNIKGKIDKNANLDIDINSDTIDFAKFSKFILNLPLIKKSNLNIKDYQIRKGLLTINSHLKGTIKKPEINSSSNLQNLDLYVSSKKANLNIQSIKIIPEIVDNKFKSATLTAKNIAAKQGNLNLKSPELKLKIQKNTIELLKSSVNLNNITSTFEGSITNIDSKNPLVNLKGQSDINKNNDLVIIKNFQNPKAQFDILIKNNNLYINNCSILNEGVKLADIEGVILNFADKNPTLNKLKVITTDKISFTAPALDNLSAQISMNIEAQGKLENPKINGDINLYYLKYPKLGLYVDNAIMNLKDSVLYLNIVNAKIFDSSFDLVSQAKYQNDKIIVDWANYNSNYINFEKVEKYLSSLNFVSKNSIEILNLKGKINALDYMEFNLNNVNFEGSFINEILKLSKFDAQIFNGKIEGSLETSLLTQRTKTNLVLKDINLRLVKGAIKELSIAVSGKLSSFISGEFIGFEYNDLLKTFNGYVKFNINDGELAHFAKLERFLQAGNILSQSILKLTLNSTLSTVTKQNTGYFKTIEGTLNIRNSIANIQYLKSQGTNMSLYLEGKFNLLTKNARLIVLGKIPSHIVNVLGDIGNFKTETLVNKLSTDTKEIVKSITSSPLEKMLSTKVGAHDLEKIPPLIYNTNSSTREFLVKINGKLDSINSIQIFKWVIKD